MKEIYYIKRQETKNNPTRRNARCPLISFAENELPYMQEISLRVNCYYRLIFTCVRT